MMASEIPAAINPYSIEVAPDSSRRNCRKRVMAGAFYVNNASNFPENFIESLNPIAESRGHRDPQRRMLSNG
jgi:hypothetical protein